MYQNKIDRQNREWWNVPTLTVVPVVLVQCNLVDIQYRQKSDVLYVFTLNESYAYFLNVEPGNLVFYKAYNTEFDEIIITFTDQNDRPLEIEDKNNLIFLINKWKWYVTPWNQEQKNMSNEADFGHSWKIYLTNLGENYWVLLQKQE